MLDRSPGSLVVRSCRSGDLLTWIDWIALRAFLSFQRPAHRVDTSQLMSTRRPVLLIRAKPLLSKTYDYNITPPSFSFFILKDIPMPLYKTSQRLNLVKQVLLRSVLAIVTYTRCAQQQKECRLSSLSRKYSECIYTRKKYEPAKLVINFSSINKAIEKLKQEEIKIEATQEATNKIAYIK